MYNLIVPSDFKKVLDSYSARGYRVIALAYRQLTDISLATAISMQRYYSLIHMTSKTNDGISQSFTTCIIKLINTVRVY